MIGATLPVNSKITHLTRDTPAYRDGLPLAESGDPGSDLFVRTGFAVKSGTPERAAQRLQSSFCRVVVGADVGPFCPKNSETVQ